MMKVKPLIGPLGLLAVLFAGWAVVFQPLEAARSAASAEAETLLAQRAALLQRLEEFGSAQTAASLDPELLWNSSGPTDVAAGFQRRTLELAEGAGLSFRSISSMPTVRLGPYQRLTMTLEGDASLEQIATFLTSVEQHRPAVRVMQFGIRHAPGTALETAGTPVSARFELWALAPAGEAQ